MALIATAFVSRFSSLLFAPVACVVGGVAFSDLFAAAFAAVNSRSKGGPPATKQLNSHKFEAAILVVTAGATFLAFFVLNCTWAASSISKPSIFLTATEPDGTTTIYDDYRDAYQWLALNTPEDA